MTSITGKEAGGAPAIAAADTDINRLIWPDFQYEKGEKSQEKGN
jgi:hypothetical protein